MKNLNCYKGEKKKTCHFFLILCKNLQKSRTQVKPNGGKFKMSKATQNVVTDQNWYKKKKKEESRARQKDNTNRKIQMWRDCVSVSDSGLVSTLSVMRSESLHDTPALADMNPSRVTPTGWEGLRTRPCWRTRQVVMCYMPDWHEGQRQLLGRRC